MVDVLYLETDDVRDLASMADYVDAVREGFRERGRGAVSGSRAKLSEADPESFLLYYGAMFPESGVMGVFSYVAGFAGADTWHLTYLVDAHTGRPLALIDSPAINPYKTGAVGAVGVDALARADAETLGMVGSGTQARGQLLATDVVCDLTDVAVYSPTPSNREAFATEMNDRVDAEVRAVGSSREAVADRDVVVTATTSSEPVFDGRWLSAGTHVTAMGQSHPDRRELDATTVARSRYVADLRHRAETGAGSYLAAVAEGTIEAGHLDAELGEILVGDAPGRTDDDQITVFDSGGTGIETIAASFMVYERARKAGVGTTIAMTPGSEGLDV